MWLGRRSLCTYLGQETWDNYRYGKGSVCYNSMDTGIDGWICSEEWMVNNNTTLRNNRQFNLWDSGSRRHISPGRPPCTERGEH